MIKMMFKPFFKKFVGLFISMAFVSMLAIALLVAFGSTIVNLNSKYSEYLRQYGDVDEQISTSLALREDFKAIETEVEGVERVDTRLTLDMYVQKVSEQHTDTLTARLFSFNEDENEIFHRYIYESTAKNLDKDSQGFYKYTNVSIIKKFAKNNNIKLGDTLKVGYGDYFIHFYVNEIIETAEAIYPRANEYVWSDNQKFGYIYISEPEFSHGFTKISNVVFDKITEAETEEEKQQIRDGVEKMIELFGLPDILDPNLEKDYVSKFGNQIIVKNKDGFTQTAEIEKIKAYLNNKSIAVTKALTGDMLPYKVYMENAKKQLNIAAIFLPVFFYSVTMIIIGLFMNQIIKAMTPDIGVMMSIGVGKRDIISIFLFFALLMGLVSGIIGSLIGWGIDGLLTSIMIQTYSIPVLTSAVNPMIGVIAIGGLILFAEIATFLSCLAIFKITPKDAVISNESKRKKNPKVIEKIIDKSPMNIKLGLNSVFQNPKRFFVATFSIFASFVLTMLCCNFYVAKEAMMSQSVELRLNYDCQVYMQGISTDEEKNAIKNLPMVTAFEDCYYTYLNVIYGDINIYIETLAVDPNSTTDMIHVPDISGFKTTAIPETGIVLPLSAANNLNVKIGDTISIGGTNIEVKDISYQYFHPIAYVSRTQMESLGEQAGITYTSNFLVNVSDSEGFSQYFVDNQIQALTVFSENLAKDLYAIFKTIDLMIFIMIGFAFGIGFIILCIMSQNTLLEQKRQVSVLRLIGFKISDISNYWSLQSIAQVILSLIFAIPAGIGSSMLLFNMASSASQIYPFILSWPVILISIGFVLVTVISTHSIAMLTVRNWNLADNTRSRE